MGIRIGGRLDRGGLDSGGVGIPSSQKTAARILVGIRAAIKEGDCTKMSVDGSPLDGHLLVVFFLGFDFEFASGPVDVGHLAGGELAGEDGVGDGV